MSIYSFSDFKKNRVAHSFNDQVAIEISDTSFQRFRSFNGKHSERFWYVKEEFLCLSKELLAAENRITQIDARLEGERWLCSSSPVTRKEVSFIFNLMRLFYMESEFTSILNFSSYMANNIPD